MQDHDTHDVAEHDVDTADRENVERTDAVNLNNRELLKKARNASNGAKFERLWNGNTAGYDSQSEADMALCCLLSFWTGGDRAQMDQLFRESGLRREKWDEVHYADGSTYGEKTIKRAIANTTEFYDPESGRESTQTSTPSARVSVSAGNNDSGTSAYVAEKNRLLTDRITELEATLDRKNERIDVLEAEVERLEAELEDHGSEVGHVHGVQTSSISAADRRREEASVWDRTKRLFQRGSE